MDRKIFGELRDIAARRRDAVITKALTEFNESLCEIIGLEFRILGEPAEDQFFGASEMKLPALIRKVIPSDATVDFDDVYQLVHLADPGRNAPPSSVRNYLWRLVKSGAIVRVSDPNGSKKALYSLPVTEPEPTPNAQGQNE